jgi:hypothetical protein
MASAWNVGTAGGGFFITTGRSSPVVQCAMPGLDASSSMAGSAVVLHVHCTGAMMELHWWCHRVSYLWLSRLGCSMNHVNNMNHGNRMRHIASNRMPMPYGAA